MKFNDIEPLFENLKDIQISNRLINFYEFSLTSQYLKKISQVTVTCDNLTPKKDSPLLSYNAAINKNNLSIADISFSRHDSAGILGQIYKDYYIKIADNEIRGKNRNEAPQIKATPDLPNKWNEVVTRVNHAAIISIEIKKVIKKEAVIERHNLIKNKTLYFSLICHPLSDFHSQIIDCIKDDASALEQYKKFLIKHAINSEELLNSIDNFILKNELDYSLKGKKTVKSNKI